MRIKLSPTRSDQTLVVSKAGDKLTINGEVFDFSFMTVGDTLVAGAVTSDWIIGPVHKTSVGLELTLVLPLPANSSQAQRFPVDLVNVPNGPVTFPQPEPVLEVPA